MKYFVACIAVAIALVSGVVAASGALSPWLSLSSNAYLLPPTTNYGLFLMANVDSRTGKLSINMMNIEPGTSLCVIDGENQTSDLGEIAPFKINGQYVRMRSACFNGTEVDQPVTDAGKAYLIDLVDRGTKIQVEVNSHVVLSYIPANFSAVKTALTQAHSAM